MRMSAGSAKLCGCVGLKDVLQRRLGEDFQGIM